ncbi:NB-ARC domain-containing protein [Tengunoibacter tsumagoiensis]|uniref:HTH cro/C1-type domain-containing protein n=1 Tax=Tengunoibacter tsumagoiensis TaxID=2014871 RepID=A0A401ZVD7_9CHLR|nr:NB-ARC domain-containing protein [Tengunoibacter tsumagoiensis]GCE10875.1 hypothetical protein KTT_07340 [Tengunoibacter tsumagoiensis]
MKKKSARIRQPNRHLIAARTALNWTQRDVADGLDVPTLTVGRWERGEAQPHFFHRVQLCNLFGKTEEELGFFLEPTADASITQKPAIDISLPPVCDSTIPEVPSFPLVGRSQLLAQIKERFFAEPGNTMVALNGLPGVGKTALAIALAHDKEMKEHYHDGILWAGIGIKPQLLSHLNRWGALLGLTAKQMQSLQDWEDWAKALRTAIGSRALLIVLDDVWQLEEVLALKIGGPQCAYLVTTRFPSIAAHLTVKDSIQLQELSLQESLQLVNFLAPQILPATSPEIERLVQSVSGLPLALVLISNYMRKQVYAGSARRRNTALERLSNVTERMQLLELYSPSQAHPSLPGSHAYSLQSIIAVSDQFLTPSARNTLYSLAVFPAKPQTFSERAALQLTNCRVEDLDILIDAGLLECVSNNRYSLHQVIADYARLRLASPDIYERFVRMMIAYAKEHQNAGALLEAEQSSLLAALDQAQILGLWLEFLDGAKVLIPFLLARGMYSSAQSYNETAARAAELLALPLCSCGVLLYKGQIYIKQGEYTLAQTALEEALAWIPPNPDEKWLHLQCDILNERCNLELKLGQNEQAEILLQQTLALVRASSYQTALCITLSNLGTLHHRRGRHEEAVAVYQEGLMLARQLQDGQMIGLFLRSLGTLEAYDGSTNQATKYLQEALEITQLTDDYEEMINELRILGEIALIQGQIELAECYQYKALGLAEKMHHYGYTSVIHCSLAEIFMVRGHYAQAEHLLHEGRLMALTAGYQQELAMLLIVSGHLAAVCGQYQQAAIYLQEGQHLATQMQDSFLITYGKLQQGIIQIGLAQLQQAEETLQETLVLALEHNYRSFAANIYLYRSQIAQQQQAYQQALAYLEPGLQSAYKAESTIDLCFLYYQYTIVYIQQHELMRAEVSLQKMSHYLPAGAQILLARYYFARAQLAAAQGEREEALQLGKRSIQELKNSGDMLAQEIGNWFLS